MLQGGGEACSQAVQPLHYEKAQQASNVPICLSFTKDLAECKLVSFPIGIYKVLRNVTDQIHVITLANNELKSLTSKFVTTFCQLRELRLEGNFLHRLPNEVSTLQHLKAINLSRNQFRDFPEQLTTLPALETINLEENDIVDVPVEKLAAMPALRSVNLRFNPLSAEALFLVLRASRCPERKRRQPPSV
ncbi:leucine-rich repeat-containing protein 20 isoform X4 [Ursus maritimus]|uniref:Leucine-rich repeat-containing protein 20 isoform X4 n=1 Tax=Ursus maritimus TaxID=29073 RepID=A0A8M1FBW2_URSMA|nr:leucine-rich repeat-containing protein 20 isoform X4 [Ursus maritimus]